MSDDQPQPICVVDCSGLCEIARTKSDNLKALYKDQLNKGLILVPTCVWDEFSEVYEEEAAFFDDIQLQKVNMSRRYQVGAARLADKLNSRFSLSAYDSQSDLFTAAIASLNNYTILTAASLIKQYSSMDCDVTDLATWANQLGEK